MSFEDIPSQFLGKFVVSSAYRHSAPLLRNLHNSGQGILDARLLLGIFDGIEYLVLVLQQIISTVGNNAGRIVVVHALASRAEHVISDHFIGQPC